MSIISILFKLWPAIKDTLFGDINLSFYLKRNKAIAVLGIALLITFLSFLYVYEQAVMHGVRSKQLEPPKVEVDIAPPLPKPPIVVIPNETTPEEVDKPEEVIS